MEVQSLAVCLSVTPAREGARGGLVEIRTSSGWDSWLSGPEGSSRLQRGSSLSLAWNPG
jgi:hypothetical protein